jgi:hypothetical protein
MEPLSAKVARITKELGLPESLLTVQAIEQANEQLGLEHAAGTSLKQQANAILTELGLGAEVPLLPAVPVSAEAAVVVATGKVAQSPPEHSSGTGAPPPTEGRVPAVPMRYGAPTERVVSKCNLWICSWNVAAVVGLLLTVWFYILVAQDVLTGTLLPTPSPPPPPLPPQAPTTCPFDVVACNRQCALMHLICTARQRPKKPKNREDCDGLHGGETANRSTAAFDGRANKTAYLESLDWEHEPILWGLREEHVGNGRCDRSGCGATLCECNFDGGDCVVEEVPSDPWYILMCCVFSSIAYLVVMCEVFKVIGFRFEAPKLRDEGELTAYVTKMQRAQLQVSFSVVCSHSSGGIKGKTVGKSQPKTVVTHRSSHPFTYSTSTDVSTLTKNWQQPAGGGGGEDGGLGTGFVAVVSSGLSWSAAKGATADKLKAEKKRLYDANKHRDKYCSVTVRASLPGCHSHLLYAPADAKFTKRLSPVAELLLVCFGFGAPLIFYYERRLSRHVAHTVRKTLYIEGHAEPDGHAA